MNDTAVVVILAIIFLSFFTVSAYPMFEEDNNDYKGVYEHYLDIQADKTVFSQNEDIILDIILFNNDDSPATYEGSGAEHRANVWIYDIDGNEVWNNVPDAQDTDYDLITVPANDRFFLQTVIWTQADNNGAQVPPGKYEVIAMNDHTPGITGALSITII